ncbi:MAG: hypothetical protein DDT23_01340 [candidate division WS2 bacterium]|nr:hypothetical protein [Candidatus Lithacetigena glycinireducens]
MKLDNINWQQLWEEHCSIRAIARITGKCRTTVRKKLVTLGLYCEKSSLNPKWCQLIDMIDSIAPKGGKPLYLIGDWMITSDYHIPAIHVGWYETMLEVAGKYNIKNIIIAGDLINFDLISYYWKEKPDIRTATIAEEVAVTKKILRDLETRFNQIVWLEGNHEKRFYDAMQRGVSVENLLSLLECLQTKYLPTSLSYCYLDDIRITHPKSYRQTKLSVANVLASKYRCSVLQAHGHFFALGYSQGGYIIGDTGGLMDIDRITYMQEADSTHPLWNNGFFVYKDKKIIPYGVGIGL